MKHNLSPKALLPLRKLSFLSATMAVAVLAAASAKADLVFDNMSNVANGVAGATVNATGSTPNTFMGDGYVLAAGTADITGFDLFPVNLAGTTYTRLTLNIYVWGTVNTGSVAVATPAFGNLLGSYSFTSDVGSYPSGNYFTFTGVTPGVTPGLTLSSPLAISSTTIGLTFNIQGTTDGITYANVNSLSTIIASGTAPTVGSMVLGGATGGYYRNANSEVNGNFTSTLRSLGGLTGQGLGVRVYGDVTPVPEPTTLALIGGGAVLLFLSRRRA